MVSDTELMTLKHFTAPDVQLGPLLPVTVKHPLAVGVTTMVGVVAPLLQR